MQALITFIRPFLFIVAQRAGPEILPKSRFLLALVIVAHFSIYYLGMIALDVTAGRDLALPFLDTVLQFIFFAVLVGSMGMQDRLIQMLTAIFGADAILNLVSIPLAMAPQSEPPGISFTLILSIVVLLWSLGVKGYILQRTVGLPYFVGVVIAAGFYIAFVFLDNALFGAPI